MSVHGFASAWVPSLHDEGSLRDDTSAQATSRPRQSEARHWPVTSSGRQGPNKIQRCCSVQTQLELRRCKQALCTTMLHRTLSMSVVLHAVQLNRTHPRCAADAHRCIESQGREACAHVVTLAPWLLKRNSSRCPNSIWMNTSGLIEPRSWRHG